MTLLPIGDTFEVTERIRALAQAAARRGTDPPLALRPRNQTHAYFELYQGLPLVERQARTLAKYAYQDIGSGPIEKAHVLFTQKLGEDPEKAWKKIADILKRMKGWGYAAQCYANAGMEGTAARMFEKQLKDGQRAAFYYEENEEFVRAARMYKKSKLHDKAGSCYLKAGMMKLAVQQWKKAGTLKQHNVGEQVMERILRK